MKILEVTWTDAVGADEWEDQKSVKNTQLARITSVGYLVAEDEKKLTLTLSIDHTHENYGAYLVIPKVNIVKKKRVC